jgi:hypothetical protein
VSDILKVARKLKEIEAELYSVRRSLEPKMSEAEMRAASSILKGIEARRIVPNLAKLPELLRKS